MAAPPPPPPSRGLSLYENLHDPNDPAPSATISSGPVLYNQDGAAAAPVKKPIDPALRFQPTRRPQPTKPKAKATAAATFPKSIARPAAAAAAAAHPTQAAPPPTADASAAPPASKSTLADWAATEDDEWLYGTGEKRQRGGRKAKKKRQQQQQQMETDWDDVYDPSRPTNVDEYLRSDEKVDEVREWKALLYRHRKGKAPESDLSSDDDEGERAGMRPKNQFAPPPSYAAVPPPPASPPTTSAAPPPPPPSDASGDDAYARRIALSSSQPPTSSTTISAAPVLYNTTTAQEPARRSSSPSPPRSSRPGQAGFAHRLMSKYGWESGRGLGADSSGIVNPLRVQVEKRRKKADADGGGWAEPANKGKIIGGGKRKDAAGNEEQGLSDVIVLLNMLDNMPDLAAEVEDGLGQEIGEECGEKYGRVERVYIDTVTQRVFIKFTDQISALRAVSELQGRVFNGNTITPRYYNSDAFDRSVYTK
ncbi:uncharacterized protein LMH87_007801 [Akanthomyces muscarius]|uniref:G-patch domain-containing protein n=1 Tax=Akanthomyces muscarius TaxID=2231603 RepID=A0A9W8QIX8_AKAMU|nr:uncharacterized protein LMH87_007801 [Akanthomyces muscarius]KAJ4159863.1 hypothetical protein LMH87_007801 [Akanthomyces muscarius]